MKVYIVFEEYPYEGEEILGIYGDESKADLARKLAEDGDTSKGYHSFYIRSYEVLS